MNRPRSMTVLATALALAVTALSSARDHDDERRGKRGREREERVERLERPKVRVSLDQAVAMAERRYDARVVRTDTRDEGDRVVYVLRLLNDAGRVWTVKVDASSGSMH